MTTKYITTYIAGGYTVASGVTELIITPTGGVGGGEILASHYLDLFNEGVVNDRVAGGSGIELQGGGKIFNGSATYTGATIRGTIGVSIRAATGYVTNQGTIEGGSSLYGARGQGVALDHGGTITNGASNSRNALIEGGSSGVLISGGFASVANFGTIESIYRQGVYLLSGGIVTNGSQSDVSALIEGTLGGVTFVSGVGIVENYGTIESQSGSVVLSGGGSVTNGAVTSPGALITGAYGVMIAGGVGTVTNFGTIKGLGPAEAAVTLAAGGVVTNGSSGDAGALISGVQGVSIGGTTTGTVTNYGSIIGLGGAYEAGVSISGAASVFNGAAGLIEGGEGIGLAGGGLVRNLGTIRGEANFGTGGAGVLLAQGGQVSNGFASDRTALISGDYGVLSVGSGTVNNLGTIIGVYQSSGVELGGGGVVTNGSTHDAAALISGYNGVRLFGAAGLANFGTVAGIGGYGVLLDGVSGTVTNGSAGHTRATLSGYIGVEISSGAVTINNFGTISGDSGTALAFYSGLGSVFLEVEAGSVFQGAVLGNAASTLDLASGTGTLSGLSGTAVTVSGSMAATTFSGFGTVEVGAGAVFTLNGGATLLAGQTLMSAGLLTAGASVTNGGVLESLGGTVVISGAVTGSGKAAVNGGTLDFASSFNQAVTFMTKGTLELAQSQIYTATITGFSKTGATSLDLVDIGFVSSTEATFSGTSTGGVLTVTDGTHTAKINLKGNYLGSTWIASSDGHGGTTVIDPRARAGASPLALAAAMAAMAPASAPTGTQTVEPWRSTTTPLIAPRGG